MGALNRNAQPLAGRVIGVYASGGAPWHHLALAASFGAEVRPVRAEDVAAGRLEGLDSFVVPGGGATAMAGLLAPLGTGGAEAIREWVRAGGNYVSSCAGSVLPLALTAEADELLPTARCLRMVEVPMANPGDATLGGLASPGVGRIEVRLDRGHPIADGLPERVSLIHYNGPLFDVTRAPPEVLPFAWPEAASAAFTPAERFLTEATANRGTVPEAPATASSDTLTRCIAAGAATALEARVGAGRAVLFGSHPEFGLGPLLLGWAEGAALLAAALQEPRAARPARVDAAWATRPELPELPVAALAERVMGTLERAAERFEVLADRDLGAWLDPDHAASFHGREARTAWRADSIAASRVAGVATRSLGRLLHALDEADRGWLDDLPRAGQDFGAMGLWQLAERIDAMLQGAETNASLAPRRPAHAYDLFDTHPFHLAVGSYLSAAGLVAAALLSVQVLAARHDARLPEAERSLFSSTDGLAHPEATSGERRPSPEGDS